MASTAQMASNLLGTLPAAQLSGPVPSANVSGTYGNAVTFNNASNSFNGAFSGDGNGLTGLNASGLTSGTVPDTRLPANVAQLSANQTFTGTNILNNAGNRFTGNGAGLTGLDASSLVGGTVPDARLSSNVAQLNSQTNMFNGVVVANDVKLAGGTQSAVSALDSIRLVRGNVLPNGAVTNGTGFMVERSSIGSYKVFFSPPFTDSPTFVVTVLNGNSYRSATPYFVSGTYVALYTWFGSTLEDNSFGFIAIGTR
jgi:hypothetical protein